MTAQCNATTIKNSLSHVWAALKPLKSEAVVSEATENGPALERGLVNYSINE